MSSNSFDSEVNLDAFTYDLPKERIAKSPLSNRSDSKLLVSRKGEISHRKFSDISSVLPKDSHLVFNDTRVIPARLHFRKESGASIEIFLLEPLAPSTAHEAVMASHGKCTWKVMIGNAKRWKLGTELTLVLESSLLTAKRVSNDEVLFTWDEQLSFSEILGSVGKVPLPPYLEREATETDKPRYQTVYSKTEGAVAAPTAGLHFTETILTELTKKDISTDYLTLHVSAGTFQPIKVKNVKDHNMHQEQVIVSKSNILNLIGKDQVIAVGTTSMRTLESLYWFGVKLANDSSAGFFIEKLYPYSSTPIPKDESLKNVLNYMDQNNLAHIVGQTEIFILPGYEFKICRGLVTNFHLPGSTLILLVAALVGDHWKSIYQSALDNNYRFLSYGDSSLLIPQ